jgi:hypothetical protein
MMNNKKYVKLLLYLPDGEGTPETHHLVLTTRPKNTTS